MATPIILTFIFLLIAVLVVVGLIVGIVLWTTGGKGSGEMSCGACGYHVRGLSQLSCPECGADLREAGIAKGGNPGRRTTGIVLTCICGGLLVLGCGLTGFTWLMSTDSSSVQHQNATQTLQSPLQTVQPQPITPPQRGPNPDGTSADDADKLLDLTGDDETDR